MNKSFSTPKKRTRERVKIEQTFSEAKIKNTETIALILLLLFEKSNFISIK